MRHKSGRLKDVQSRTNWAIVDEDGSDLRMSQVGWTLATTLRSSGKSRHLTEFVALQEMRTCSMESMSSHREHAGLLLGWSWASLSFVR